MYDYSDEREEAAPDQRQLLQRLADQLDREESLVETAERQLRDAQERVRKLRENDIPELMNSMGCKEIITTNGMRVRLREEIRAGLPKDPAKREEAFRWLKENGHEGLIKHEISIKFTRQQLDVAERVYEMLFESGESLNVQRKDDIHHQTLCAFLREQLRQGSGVPLPTFGAFIQKFAQIDKGK